MGDSKEWSSIPLTHGFTDNSRGIGVADMASAIALGRQHRANGELAYHVLDIMQGFGGSSENGILHNLESTCQRPAVLPVGVQEKLMIF